MRFQTGPHKHGFPLAEVTFDDGDGLSPRFSHPTLNDLSAPSDYPAARVGH